MVVCTNPRFDAESFPGADNSHLAEEDDPAERVKFSLENSYFQQEGGNSAGPRFREMLAEAMCYGPLPKPEQLSTIKQVKNWINPATSDLDTAGPDQIYFTNYYKFATPDGGSIPNWHNEPEGEFIDEMLSWEIESVDPDYVVCLGRKAWESYFRKRASWSPNTDDKTGISSNTGINKATGSLMFLSQSERMLLPSAHPSYASNNPTLTDPTANSPPF